jgi:hypothetical protein
VSYLLELQTPHPIEAEEDFRLKSFWEKDLASTVWRKGSNNGELGCYNDGPSQWGMCLANFSERQRTSRISVAGGQNGKTMKKLGIILFGMALLAQPVQAQYPEFAPPWADGAVVKYKFDGVQQYWSGWGMRTGPYNGTILGPTNPGVTIYCVDFHQRLRPGWITATALNLANPANFPVAQLSGPASNPVMTGVTQAQFQQAAFLASLFYSYNTMLDPVLAALTPHVAHTRIHGAIWNIVSGAQLSDPNGYVEAFEKYALAHYGSHGQYSGWYLLETQTEFGGPSQHFLAQAVQAQTVTPEPQTYILLGSGLLFLVFVGRRRLKENGYS